MAVTNVLMDTAAPRGSKLDPEVQDEIKALGPGREDGEVTEDALGFQAVSRDKIAPGAVGSAQIDEQAVQEANMAPLSVGSTAIKDDYFEAFRDFLLEHVVNSLAEHLVVIEFAATYDRNTEFFHVNSFEGRQ